MTEPGDSGRNMVTPLYAALTVRGRVLLGGAAALVAAGLILRYPELIGIGAAGLAAVVVALASVAPSRITSTDNRSIAIPGLSVTRGAVWRGRIAQRMALSIASMNP